MVSFGLRILFILLATALLTAPAEARKHTTEKCDMEFDGKLRHYVVHVPKGCGGKPVPLVVVLHGGLTNARYVAFESKMSEKADRDKFVLVYPEGSGGIGRNLLTWNAGHCCGPAQWNSSDDVGFLRELIARVREDYNVDPHRIYVAGSSNGGMMAYRVAAELADVVAAVCSVNGCVQTPDLKLTRPISVLAFNGSNDKVIKVNGGVGSMFGYKIDCPDAHETIKRFATEVGCSGDAEKEVVGRRAIREVYSGGPGGTEVCLYTLPISHFWSGGRRPFPAFGLFKREVSATDVMCDFFWSHPKRDGV